MLSVLNWRGNWAYGVSEQTRLPPPATSPTPTEQQARFDVFRSEYNDLRPHEALGQEPPGAHYRASPRPYPERVAEPWYDAEHAVRRVRSTGEIKWGGELVFINEALAGEPVGVAETEDGDWIVRFLDVDLGIIDRTTHRLRRFAPARPGRCKAPQPEQTEKTVNHVPGPNCQL